MPLFSDKTNDAYANSYRDSEILSALKRLDEPEISPNTRSYLDPDVVSECNYFDSSLYQNATIYVGFQCQGKSNLLVTVNKARGIKDINANKAAMTPGGRRDRDHGLLYTGLKELEEETHLMVDTICQQFPQATIRYLQTAQIDSKRGFFNFKAQLHCYSIFLGEITPSQAAALQKEIRPGDDVEFAEFVDVSTIIATGSFKVRMSGLTQDIALLPAVKNLAIQIFTDKLPSQATEPCLLSEAVFLLLAPTQLASSSSCEIALSSKSATVEKNKAHHLLEWIAKAQNFNEPALVTRLVKTLLLVVSVETLTDIALTTTKKEDKSEREGVNIANIILDHYCKLTLKQIAEINLRHQSQSAESQIIQQQLSQLNMGDDSRFRIAQKYIFDEPHKRYSRVLRRQVCDNCVTCLERSPPS